MKSLGYPKRGGEDRDRWFLEVRSKRMRGNSHQMQDGGFLLDTKKVFLPLRVVKLWKTLLSKPILSRSLEIIKTWMEKTLCKLVTLIIFEEGGGPNNLQRSLWSCIFFWLIIFGFKNTQSLIWTFGHQGKGLRNFCTVKPEGRTWKEVWSIWKCPCDFHRGSEGLLPYNFLAGKRQTHPGITHSPPPTHLTQPCAAVFELLVCKAIFCNRFIK